ncbi:MULTISPECIES: PspC domain-containing protein [unclassified Nocardioides]|uniref:PspC domain-containing protein n=1 Tax=unclassified Nocardioides TaxID=2615069 RepID=UPI00361E7FED
MNTTPPEAPPPPQPGPAGGPRVSHEEMRNLGRLRRSITDRKVAGVAGGLGRHLDVDPLVLRVAFVVLVFFGGAGLILYGACWLLVPEDGSDRAPFNLDEKSRTVALVVVGAIAALALVGDSWGAFWFPWPLAIVALVALWLLTRNSPSQQQGPAPTSYAAPYAPTGAPTQTNPYDVPATSSFAGPATGPALDPTYAPAPPPYVPPAAPITYRPNPRKRGPILFWFTLALIVLAEGVLGIVDLAGGNVADPAYPALAVAISGVMLLVGAFYGRAGGIILLGLLSTIGLVGATAASEWDGDQVTVRPTTAASVDTRYWLGAGEQVIDLRGVTDLEELDGRLLDVEGGMGRIEVIIPRDLAATVTADIDGPGQIDLFGEGRGGIDVSFSTSQGSPTDPEIIIRTQLGVGQIEVNQR